MTRDQRLAQIVEVDFDLGAYVPDVYRTFSTEATDVFFQTVHRTLSLVALQAGLGLAERLTAISPESVVPYQRTIWTPIRSGATGQYTLPFQPYSILGVKQTVGLTPDWIDSATYNQAAGRIEGLAPNTDYWIPEILYPNPWIWHHLGRPIGLTPSDVPEGYSPVHTPPYIQLVREGIRGGTRRRTLTALCSAVAGNPFAYVAGTVTAVTSSTITVTPTEGPPVDHQRIDGTSSQLSILPLGAVVKRFDPLVGAPVVLAMTSPSENGWGTPVAVTEAAANRMVLENPFSCAFGDRVRVRVLATGFDHTYLVRHAEANTVIVEGVLPLVTSAGQAVAQRFDVSPEVTQHLTITAVSRAQNGHEATLRALVARALPPTLGYTLLYT